MLLIACPWCGPREETEFSCGGEAHIARPADPDALSDEQWGDYLFMRKNPRGAHLEQWVHAHGCRRWFNVAARHGHVRDHAVYKVGERRRPTTAATCTASEPDLPLARRRPHRPPHAAAFHVQRQALRGARRRHARLRAARQRRHTSSRGAGNTIARAASSPAASRSPTPSCSSKPAPPPCPTRARPK